MFDDIIMEALGYLDNNQDLELVEIIKSTGATPRSVGAFMFVNKDAESFGTVGGGNVEYQATLYAKELLMKKMSGEKEYNLSQNKAQNIGMVCGGDNLLKFTYLTNDENSKKILEELKLKNKNKNVVYIFGGGHVSMELAKILKYVGFDYVVWDDRKEFANEERFKDANKIICKDFDNINSEINITNNDFIVIMTRGHAYDYIVEKQILRSGAYYIGVIGSRNKNRVIKENLLADGFSENEIDSVCAPIGLSISADTPEEIAISIGAELILFRSKLENRRKIDRSNLLEFYKGKMK